MTPLPRTPIYLYARCLSVWLMGSGIIALAPGHMSFGDYVGAVLIGAGAAGPSWLLAAKRHR